MIEYFRERSTTDTQKGFEGYSMIKTKTLPYLTAVALIACILGNTAETGNFAAPSGSSALQTHCTVPDRYRAQSSAVYLEKGRENEVLYEYQWALNNRGQIRLIDKISGNVLVTGSGVAYGENIAWEEDFRKVTEGFPGIDIHAEEAWKLYEPLEAKHTVTVALIDTGVDLTHPELSPGLWVNADELPGDGIDNDHNGYIDDIHGWNFIDHNHVLYRGAEDDHGTHAAGTIAGQWDGKGITGINDSNYVKIMVLKALGADGTGDSRAVIEAIRYAQNNGARICNLSFGSDTYDWQLEKVIRESPMLFVISAGNGDAEGKGIDIDQSPVYPAAYTSENIISVANLMFDGNLHESSNFGLQGVDLAAPGSYILSTTANHGFGYMTGTSMAAPVVTAAVAMLASCRPELSAAEMKNAILSSVQPLGSLYGKVKSCGMLDLYALISASLVQEEGEAANPVAEPK